MRPARTLALASLLAWPGRAPAARIVEPGTPLTFERLGGDTVLPQAMYDVSLPVLDQDSLPDANIARIKSLPSGNPLWVMAAARLADVAGAASAKRGAAPEATALAALKLLRSQTKRRLTILGDRAAQDMLEAADFQELALIGALTPLLGAKQRTQAQSLLSRHEGEIAPHAINLVRRDMRALAARDASPELLVTQYGLQSQLKLSGSLPEQESSLLIAYGNIPGGGSSAFRPLSHVILRSDRPLDAAAKDVLDRDRQLRWVDVGGGLGAAQGRWAWENPGAAAIMTLVDLFDWRRLAPHRLDPERTGLGTYVFQREPDFLVLQDAARFAPRERPNFITLFNVLDYMPDKLKTLLNLYDQLDEGGIMAILSAHEWPRLLQEAQAAGRPQTLFQSLLAALEDIGAETLGLTLSPRQGPLDIFSLFIRKTSLRRLRTFLRLEETRRRGDGSSGSFYRRGNANQPLFRSI
ncbi:MAG: hypothetical protein HY552_06550 [Elusimicrobia bacterium]|nr:hypothetical protein [Elusimicrobiota bacterium]